MSDQTLQQYNSPLTRSVVRLVELAVKGEEKTKPNKDGKKQPFILGIIWKMLEPQLPMMLYSLDNDPKALGDIQREILRVSQEIQAEARGPGRLAWIASTCPEMPGITFLVQEDPDGQQHTD